MKDELKNEQKEELRECVHCDLPKWECHDCPVSPVPEVKGEGKDIEQEVGVILEHFGGSEDGADYTWDNWKKMHTEQLMKLFKENGGSK